MGKAYLFPIKQKDMTIKNVSLLLKIEHISYSHMYATILLSHYVLMLCTTPACVITFYLLMVLTLVENFLFLCACTKQHNNLCNKIDDIL